MNHSADAISRIGGAEYRQGTISVQSHSHGTRLDWQRPAPPGPGHGGQPGFQLPDAPEGADLALLRKAHWAIDRVTGVMASGRFAFNSAIAAVMELTNEVSRQRDEAGPGARRAALEIANSLLFPFAPHAAADGYDLLTGARVWEQPWPEADPAYLASDTYELVCQVNGKLRSRMTVQVDCDAEKIKADAQADEKLAAFIGKNKILKVIYVHNKLHNIVVAP